MFDESRDGGGAGRTKALELSTASTADPVAWLEVDTGGLRMRLAAFAGVALVVHGIAFLLTFPMPARIPPPPKAAGDVPEIRFVVLTPPEIDRPRLPPRSLERRMPVPDPTPEIPEPRIESTPEQVLEILPAEPELEAPEPEPPPPRVPLHPGIGGVGVPVLIASTKREPRYPELARRARIEGDVALQAVIGRDGRITELRVLRENPPGYGFAEKALAAVQQWRYIPARQGDEPVDVYLAITVRFRLE